MLNRASLVIAAVAALGLGTCAYLVHAEDQSAPAAAAVELPKADADGFIPMFDGKSLDGWQGLEGYWSVKDGVISGHETKDKSKQTFLIYTAMPSVSNFEMRFSYRFATDDGNSGVQFRSKIIDPKTDRVGGYQADFDGRGGYDGSIYDEAGVAGGRGTMSNRGEKTVWNADNERMNTPLPESKGLSKIVHHKGWNECVVVADGPRVTYSINGRLTTEMNDESPKALKSGVIALQLHAGFTMEIQFKDLKIKRLHK
ncbi:MAG TPA: DUF1080 domain-containing protein [Tepidisphaeraceae bacterium]|nr:DUF1080 domain-containing protein [Tepidisphaeraceae bacterium]